MSKPSLLRRIAAGTWTAITRIRLAMANILFLVLPALIYFVYMGGGPEPLPEKAARPVRYGASSYRLETNDGLYEGVRYVFLTYAPSWHRGQEEGKGLPLFRIVRPRVVAQVRPVAYSATYGEADAALAKIWYSAAYGVRLNMHAHDFGTGEHIC